MGLFIFGIWYGPPLIYILHQVPGRLGWWVGALVSLIVPVFFSYVAWEVSRQWQEKCPGGQCSGLADAMPTLWSITAVFLCWVWLVAWVTRILGYQGERRRLRTLRCGIGVLLALGPWLFALSRF